ncbi:hypothetical protein KSF78_0008420 [Schistosoma japonicum]|nr:hypothetical protein KSF78_0008420 [Schistosoma japonicum]
MSSSSSSSSLLYINVLLLVLIHSSIQQGLIEEYQQNFTTSENNLNQSINKVCETRLLTIEFIVRSLRDLTIVDKLLLKYLNDKNYFQLNKCKIDDTLYYNR